MIEKNLGNKGGALTKFLTQPRLKIEKAREREMKEKPSIHGQKEAR